MKSSDARNAFIDYFKSKGHDHVRSSTLIPRNDPTLLFTNAGMVQFKSVFLGEEKPPYSRAVTCQKSMRAGGKHNDIENVGHTRRHHTFFEMLGNFSFGDYFKREAVLFAWELLTEWYKLPKDKLWVSVFEEDDEAEGFWHNEVGLPKNRIVRLGAKDNFWQMADTGPCGPCSEIIIDQGESLGCGKPTCGVGCDCDRYLEIWNLVFMQFNRDATGKLTPLPKPSIDTGMGLERISAVLQGKLNNYDSDLFSEIISSIESNTNSTYGKSTDSDASIRVIADHIRAIAFLSADGLLPSNEGRGYVLRRVLRRAARHAKLLGMESPVLFKILESVASSFGQVYPELIEERDRTQKLVRMEEERFGRTLEQGLKILEDIIQKLKSSGGIVIPGEEVFKLYDTFGFPIDLARDMALDAGMSMDEDGFQKAMEIQRERARASWVGEEEAISSIYRELLSEAGPTEFVGYETFESYSTVKAILKEGKVVKGLEEGEEGEVLLDKTPFYGESGGQVGDTGIIQNDNVKLKVINTKRPLDELPVHIVKVLKGKLQVWAKVHANVDVERRRSIVANHTATHLLQSALRSVLGDHVKQAGSLVGPERLRFDFTHFSGLDRAEISAVEDIVNEKILENITLGIKTMDIQSAVAIGAMALFGEKYGDIVRVVSIPGASTELCGGAHAKATGDLGMFRIVSESSVASGIRRIEAITGRQSLNYMRTKLDELDEISQLLKSTDSTVDKVRQALDEIKELKREQEKMKGKAAHDIAGELVKNAVERDGFKIISAKVEGLDPKDLRTLADSVREKIKSGVVVLASVVEGQASFLAMVTPDLTNKFKAGDLLREVAKATEGKAGGKPELAQGGTKNIANLAGALDKVFEMVK